jgi:hypothetical protein
MNMPSSGQYKDEASGCQLRRRVTLQTAGTGYLASVNPASLIHAGYVLELRVICIILFALRDVIILGEMAEFAYLMVEALRK